MVGRGRSSRDWWKKLLFNSVSWETSNDYRCRNQYCNCNALIIYPLYVAGPHRRISAFLFLFLFILFLVHDGGKRWKRGENKKEGACNVEKLCVSFFFAFCKDKTAIKQ